MNTIRIRKHLDSDTLHLPELQSWVGKDVEITVQEKAMDAHEIDEASAPKLVIPAPPDWLPPCKSVDEIAAEQGVTPKTIDQLMGGWPPEEIDDGFEDAIRERRKRELDAAIRRQQSDKK